VFQHGGQLHLAVQILVGNLDIFRLGDALQQQAGLGIGQGAFALGFLFALALEKAAIDPRIRGPVMIGFLGAYTTFSTLMLESWRLAEDGSWGLALLNIGLSGVLGMCAVFAGLSVGRAIA